jgi:hypothetical protein
VLFLAFDGVTKVIKVGVTQLVFVGSVAPDSVSL